VKGTRPPETMLPEALCLNVVHACVTETLHPKHFLFRDAFLDLGVRICLLPLQETIQKVPKAFSRGKAVWK